MPDKPDNVDVSSVPDDWTPRVIDPTGRIIAYEDAAGRYHYPGSRAPMMRSAREWLSIWQAQPAWSAEWMLRFIQDIQKDAIDG